MLVLCLFSDGKKYDAYIIYPQSTCSPNSPDVLIFVMNILPRVLEFQCGYRLFIPGRDDPPGEGKTVCSMAQ